MPYESHRLSFKWLAYLVVGTAILLLPWACISMAGSAVVVDETEGVESAYVVTGGGEEQQLHRLWSGYFYAIPRLEGTIEVRCRDGSRKKWGYVTDFVHTKIRVVGQTPCERLIHDI